MAKITPVVPDGSVSSRTLMFLVLIMSFLSCVTFGAVVLVQRSAVAWSSEVGREITIQLRPIEGQAGEVMESNLQIATSLAQGTKGVSSAHIVTLDESKALLEPWLGSGFDASELPIPRLIIVSLSDPLEVDLAGLDQNIQAAMKGASIERHSAWRTQLNAMAGTVVVSGIMVLVLILAATILAVIFATLGTMASNREIVDVLHFIGASDSYIAREFQGRFLSIGLKGGMIGGGLAVAFFALISLSLERAIPAASAAQISTLFGRFSLGWSGLAGLFGVVLLVAALTAATSRLTVRRFLSQTS